MIKENTELKNTVSDGKEVYELTYLREHAEGDAEFLKEMIDIFLTDTPPLLDQLQADIDEGDYQKMKTTSHSMKGLFLTLGINDAASRLKQIEWMAAKEESINLIRENFDIIKSVFNKCNPLLKDELNKIRNI